MQGIEPPTRQRTRATVSKCRWPHQYPLGRAVLVREVVIETQAGGIQLTMASRPGKDGLIGTGPDELLLESEKRPLALSVNQRHVNLKEPKQAIGAIFHPGGLTGGRPRELSRPRTPS
jgi:hypothetical protein